MLLIAKQMLGRTSPHQDIVKTPKFDPAAAEVPKSRFDPGCLDLGSKKISNGKRKGSGNTKNGNKYLAWAFVEAANFAIRFNSKIKSFYQKKKSKSHSIVAIKAVAHKLCRACYYIIKDQVAFDLTKAFA